jgi:hypothetical protein
MRLDSFLSPHAPIRPSPRIPAGRGLGEGSNSEKAVTTLCCNLRFPFCALTLTLSRQQCGRGESIFRTVVRVKIDRLVRARESVCEASFIRAHRSAACCLTCAGQLPSTTLRIHPHLRSPRLRIAAAHTQQLGVAAGLDDLPVVHDVDDVGLHRGGEAVGDDDRRAIGN